MSEFRLVKLLDNPVVLQFAGGVNPQGEYDSLTPYVTGDSVSYQGSSYVVIQASMGHLPTDVAYWQALASSGYSGIDGIQGSLGTSGYSGVGTSGYSGMPGEYAAIGLSGYSGVSGYSGSGTSGY